MLSEPVPGRVIPLAAMLHIGCSIISGGLPPDVARLGHLRVVSTEEAQGTITADRAIASAVTAGHPDRSPSAYLVAPAEPLAEPSGVFIGRDLAWLLRWEGNFEFSRPGPDGSPRPMHFLYVFVDAHSGSVLDARYLE